MVEGLGELYSRSKAPCLVDSCPINYGISVEGVHRPVPAIMCAVRSFGFGRCSLYSCVTRKRNEISGPLLVLCAHTKDHIAKALLCTMLDPRSHRTIAMMGSYWLVLLLFCFDRELCGSRGTRDSSFDDLE
jgi:hypothetical protein